MKSSKTLLGPHQHENGWKESCPPVLDRLPNGGCSQARSHYCPTRVLLAARSPAWPSAHLPRQPGDPGLLRGPHIDAGLSADTRSTQTAAGEGSRPQGSPQISSLRVGRITGARHHSQQSSESWFLACCDPQSEESLTLIARRSDFGRPLENWASFWLTLLLIIPWPPGAY